MNSTKRIVKRSLLISLACSVFMAICWAIYTPNVFHNIIEADPTIPENSLLKSILFSTYYHPVSVSLIFVILFMMCLDFILPNKEGPFILRGKSRNSYLAAVFKTVFIFTLPYVLLYVVIGVSGLTFLFSSECLSDVSIIANGILSFFATFLFYIKIAVMMFFISLYVGRKFSIGIVTALYAVQLTLSVLPWTFNSDSTILFDLVCGEISTAGTIIVYVRILWEIIIFSVLSWLKFQKKDILSNEK